MQFGWTCLTPEMRVAAGAIRFAASNNTLVEGWPTAPESAAGRRSEQTYSAAIMFGLKLMPSAFATPAP